MQSSTITLITVLGAGLIFVIATGDAADGRTGIRRETLIHTRAVANAVEGRAFTLRSLGTPAGRAWDRIPSLRLGHPARTSSTVRECS